MKKIFLTLALALTPVISSFANSETIPTPTSGFSISLTGLYLQPNANNLNYAVYTHPLPLTAPNWSQIVLKPGYSPAFNLGVQYILADPSNKIDADWLYINTSNSTSFQASGANSSVAPPYYFGPLAQALLGSSAYSKTQFNVSNVGLTLGHLINLGHHIQLDPFAGLNAAYLKQDINTNYVGVDANKVPYSITSYNSSKFTGIGPRIGINATYFLTNQFGISARVGSSLLAGSMNSNTNFNSFGAGNHVAVHTTLADQSQNKLVP